VLNPLSRFGLGRIKRDAAACTDCGRCASACPMVIPVDQLRHVTASRCLTCMNCVEACPRKKGRAIFWGPPDWMGRAWPQAVVIAVLLLGGGAAVAAAYLAPLPSFLKSRGVQPDQVASVELRVQGLTCRGRANLLVGFLERDDLYQISAASPDAPVFFKLEAWPDPATATVRVSYDPRCADEDAVKRAMVEPYYDLRENRWWSSPFVIEGYDPSGLENPSGLEK